jgi:flagellar biosynthesis protein FlhB
MTDTDTTEIDWENIMNQFMEMFMKFFTTAILPMMMMVMFMRMMIGMIQSIGKSFTGGIGGY